MWRLYVPAEPYDHTPDPDERGGLAGRPEHAEAEQRMNRALLRRPAATADVIPAGAAPVPASACRPAGPGEPPGPLEPVGLV
ncbi:hypothetical protein [Streptomyces sp. NPDC059349]|uniref:hypothetical protein n=1 Tax=Streptomyces sp. NPDC059349 TaxID=3346808 RepID=UPI00369CF2A2